MLDEWLKDRAGQFDRRDLSRTFVATRPDSVVGIRAVEVDALDGAARNFYLKFGFRSLLDDPRHLFLTMAAIRKLKLDPS